MRKLESQLEKGEKELYLAPIKRAELEHQKVFEAIIRLNLFNPNSKQMRGLFNTELDPKRLRIKQKISILEKKKSDQLLNARTDSVDDAGTANAILYSLGGILILFFASISYLVIRSFGKMLNLQKDLNDVILDRDRSIERFLDLVNHLDHSMVWEAIAEPFEIIYISERSQMLLGISPGEIIKDNNLFFQAIHEQDRHRFKLMLEESFKGMRNGRIEHRMRSPDDSLIWVQTGYHCKQDYTGRIKIFGITVDITPIKRIELNLEKALRETTDFKQALDVSSIVAITDPQGTITYVNDKFCEISKYSRAELIGKNHRILNSGYHSKNFFKEMYMKISHGEVWRGEIRNRAKDGSLYWVDTVIVPFMNENRPAQYLAIRNDITNRKQVEEEKSSLINKLEIEKEARSKFVQTLTHDLKTPLTATLMSTEQISRNLENKEKIMIHLEKIKKGIFRTNKMIEDLLDFESIRAGKKLPLILEELDMSYLLRETIREYTEVHGDLFQFTGEQSVRGYWDSNGIRRLAENILNNALKYGDNKSKIIINLRKVDDVVQIAFTNKGKTLDKEEVDFLFSHFRRSKDVEESGLKGWGIGLTIVKGIAEAHGGNVKVTSENNETTFTVTLKIQPTVEKVLWH